MYKNCQTKQISSKSLLLVNLYLRKPQQAPNGFSLILAHEMETKTQPVNESIFI